MGEKFSKLQTLTTTYRSSQNYDTVDLTINHGYEHDKNRTPRDYVLLFSSICYNDIWAYINVFGCLFLFPFY
jgi:hypothetical protein